MIAVIDYGAGNLRSITNGLRKVGADVLVADAPAGLKGADGVVFIFEGAIKIFKWIFRIVR